MPPSGQVQVSSVLPLPAADVWARVTTPAGIRHELRPWASMTMPPGLRGRSIDDVGDRLGEPLGRAWLLALGVLPVDYDDMTIVALDPGRSFHERSRMLLLTRWEHERRVEPDGTREGAGRTVVRDRLTFEARWSLLLPVAHRVVAALFAHRHRRLRVWAGAPDVAR